MKPLLLSKQYKTIISARGMLHPGALSQKKWKKRLYLLLWKVLSIPSKVSFHATNEDEKKYVQQLFGKRTNVFVAANFPRIFQQQPIFEKEKGVLHLISIALISPMKNHLHVLKALREICSFYKADGLISEGLAPMIHYHIYGPVKDPVYWANCEDLIRSMPPQVNVVYHSDIDPLSVFEALTKSHVFVLPSKSENFGHAIFEALSAGKPVITSHRTPWNQLSESKAGFNVDPENKRELANAILRFTSMEKDELGVWSQGAKAYSEKAINLEEIREQYRRMFNMQN